MRTLLIMVIIAVLVLGYGYYHAATHGWLYINVMDTSAKPYAANIHNAELRLLDRDGNCSRAPGPTTNSVWFD